MLDAVMLDVDIPHALQMPEVRPHVSQITNADVNAVDALDLRTTLQTSATVLDTSQASDAPQAEAHVLVDADVDTINARSHVDAPYANAAIHTFDARSHAIDDRPKTRLRGRYARPPDT